jgi:Spy/CpxP family protein refolding chaperone
MNQLIPTNAKPRRRWVAGLLAAGTIAAVSIAGFSYATDKVDMPMHHRMHQNMSQEEMAQHIEKMVNHVLADGTPEQKSKVTAIAQAALKDIYPLRQQHHAAHDQVAKILTQPTIDRNALEQVRADEMRLADQVSRRITQAVADAAEVLTPEQRTKLAEHMKKRMG